MDIFFTGVVTLLVIALIFYVVLFGFVLYWHLTKASVFIVPMIFTFEIIYRGFIAVAVASLVLYYAPDLIRYLGL